MLGGLPSYACMLSCQFCKLVAGAQVISNGWISQWGLTNPLGLVRYRGVWVAARLSRLGRVSAGGVTHGLGSDAGLSVMTVVPTGDTDTVTADRPVARVTLWH